MKIKKKGEDDMDLGAVNNKEVKEEEEDEDDDLF